VDDDQARRAAAGLAQRVEEVEGNPVERREATPFGGVWAG
jgi:hypothetical protein